MQLFPLDPYVKKPVVLMQVVPGDPVETPIWDTYRTILKNHMQNSEPFEEVERFAFYERAKQAYAIVATGERTLYANFILKKGVISG